MQISIWNNPMFNIGTLTDAFIHGWCFTGYFSGKASGDVQSQ